LLSTPQTHIFTHAKGYKYTDYYIAHPCKADNKPVSLQQVSRMIFMKRKSSTLAHVIARCLKKH